MATHKILVVDDEESLCEILQFNLEVEGYDVDVAYSAEQALGMHPERYSLILLDVMMGEMSGFRMARILKANPETAHIPVIFCTAKDSEDGAYAVTETDQEQGSFTLGAVAEETISTDSGEESADSSDESSEDAADGSEDSSEDTTDTSEDTSSDTEEVTSRLTVISAGSLIDSQITDSFSQLENTTVFMNAVTANFDGVQNISIEPKSLQVEYNTVQYAGLLSLLVVFGIPAVVLVGGFVIWFRRRKA